MRRTVLSKAVLGAVLSGSYTSQDLRDFVLLCSNLALPLLRKKLALGKLSLSSLRMTEQDLLYDCLADLFERDTSGAFVQIRRYFEREVISIDTSSEEVLLDVMRRIVFSRVNTSVIRLHSEADPILGKILHNMDLAIERTRLFSKIVRFGETYLIPSTEDILMHQSPIPMDHVQSCFFRVVVLHETMPAMLEKLRNVLIAQKEYQRAIPFVSTGLMLKNVYALAQQAEETHDAGLHLVDVQDFQTTVEEVCQRLSSRFHGRYVEKKKVTEELFDSYICVVQRVLSDGIMDGDRVSLFEALRIRIPDLRKEEYMKKHRSRIEYLVKEGKKSLREKFTEISEQAPLCGRSTESNEGEIGLE